MMDLDDAARVLYDGSRSEDREREVHYEGPFEHAARVMYGADANEGPSGDTGDNEAEGISDPDSELAERFGELADELHLPEESRGPLLDAYNAEVQRQAADYDALVEQWAAQARQDPAALSTARAVIAEYGSAELREFLQHTGVGSHPGLVELLARVGKKLSM